MLTHIHLKHGSSPGQPLLSFPLKPSITIFVGPNNSGKSLVLNEIAAECCDGIRATNRKVLDHIKFEAVDRTTAEADYQKLKREPHPGELVQLGSSQYACVATTLLSMTKPITWGGWSQIDTPIYFASYHLSQFTLKLDGATRIGLVQQVSWGDLKNPLVPLAKMYTNNAKNAKVARRCPWGFWSLSCYRCSSCGATLREVRRHASSIRAHARS